MFKALENSLFETDSEGFESIRQRANAFNANYAGSNIIQDDIFCIIGNYIEQQGMQPELFFYPFGDDDLCACTFLKCGRVFVVINSAMTLSKQIFAAAHELYHVYNYFEENDPMYPQHGSVLDSSTIDEAATTMEDKEANAFAGLILAPGRYIQEQMDIYHIRRNSICPKDVLTLMDIFAIPYKAVVLRLFEEGIISEEMVRSLFSISEDRIQIQSNRTSRANRWQRKDRIVQFGSIEDNMEAVAAMDALNKDRIRQDKDRIQEIRRMIAENCREGE